MLWRLSSFARPSFCHRLIRQKPKPFGQSFGQPFNVSNDDAHLLNVVDRLRWTKRFVVRTQFVKNFDGSHTATAEEIGSPSKKILAALLVKTGLEFTGDRLR